MIDLVDITFPFRHKPFGTERIKVAESGASAQPVSKRFSKRVSLHQGGIPVQVTSLDSGSAINIRTTPLTPLQGHNVFGSNNVRMLCSTLICAVLKALTFQLTEQQCAAWQAGHFALNALDITQRFALPDGLTQERIFEHILRNSAWEFRPAVISEGTGVRVEAPRRHAAFLLYDKAQKLADQRTRSLKYLRAVVGDKYVEKIWKGLNFSASNSVRAELKLEKKYLSQHKLTRGAAWTEERVHEVFWEEMAHLRFESYVPLQQLRDKVDGVDKHLRYILELWARDAPVRSICPVSTFDRHRRAIRKATGIDILLDRPMIDPLPLAEIFSVDNMRPDFPKWASSYPACAVGVRARRYP
ncbi:phage/plasmid replication protein, II/X family [Pandoraea capi]|uniref:phage/plasmid replication protein, II/X family n=1 Tax=Pandoraea TaxID=93217 RepID=UPI001F5C4D33|nr:phage/plasmid replication protein, II/X family [Pandoraea capi]